MTIQVRPDSKDTDVLDLSYTRSIVPNTEPSSPAPMILSNFSDGISRELGFIQENNSYGLEISKEGLCRRIVELSVYVGIPSALQAILGDNRYSQMCGFGVNHYIAVVNEFRNLTDLSVKIVFQKNNRNELLAELIKSSANLTYHLLASALISAFPQTYLVEIISTTLAPAKYREYSKKIKEVVNTSIDKSFGVKKPDFLLRLKSLDNSSLEFPVTKEQKEKIDNGAKFELVLNAISKNLEVKVLDPEEKSSQPKIQESKKGNKRKFEENKSAHNSDEGKRETKKPKTDNNK